MADKRERDQSSRRRREARVRRGRALRRGLPLLPSLFTSGNLFCGFLAILFSVEGEFEKASLLILLAAVLDVLDGGLARLTGSESPFGMQFDSLADMISFGAAPAVLVHTWALRNMPRLGWSLAFLFVVCAAVRLARFNIQSAVADRRWFVGLPAPMAASLVAAMVFAYPSGPLENPLALATVGSLFGAAAFLMVSGFRYRSLKDVDLRRRRPHQIVFAVAAALVIASLAPQYVVLAIALTYVASGPLLRLAGVVPWPARREDQEQEEEDAPETKDSDVEAEEAQG